MPVPTASCADLISGDVCCDTTWLVGDRIRSVAFEAVCCCAETGCNGRAWRSFTTIGSQIQDPLGESLIVSMPSLSPTSTTDRGKLPILTPHRAIYLVQIRETGWPTIHTTGGGEIVVPDSNVVNAVSKHVQSHGEKMYRALVGGQQAYTLFPPRTNSHITGVTISPLTPLGPDLLVGWSMQVAVDMKL